MERFIFQVICEGIIRTVTIEAKKKEEAEKIANDLNPGCEIRFIASAD